MSLKKVLTALLLIVLGFGAIIYMQFRRDIAAAHSAVDAFDAVAIPTSFGPIDIVDDGEGPVVLSIHGTGGGFDQGHMLVRDLPEQGFRTIAPSRFGYLGAPVPEGADGAMQADAFAEILDHLGIERAIVTGASAGAISALHFAERYPERTIALLVMVPAYYPAEQAAPEPWSPFVTRLIVAALQSDFLFWAGMNLAPGAMSEALLATDRELIAATDPDEHAWLMTFFEMILPISERAPGLMLDGQNTAAPAEVDLAAITVPTLAASAEDDHYQTADSARMIAARVPGAELYVTPDGGHVWAGRADEIQAVAADFIARALDR